MSLGAEHASLPGRFIGVAAIVTGAANGIGRATAERLRAEGAGVVGVDRDADGLAALAGIEPMVADVADPAVPDEAVALAQERFGSLDLLVNNAAIQNTKGVLETTDADWDAVIAVGLTGAFRMLRAAARAMAAGAGGTIVNVSSTFAHVGSPGYAAYHAAKGGIASLTRAAAVGLKDHGIRVVAVAPGTTDTPGLRHGVETSHPDPVAAMAGYLALQPAGRFGTTDEVAAAICFLASGEASFVNGAELVVDGGYVAV